MYTRAFPELETLTRHLSPRTTFASLAYPNYRLWFFGQMVSLFGTWMQSTAQGYLIFSITNSTLYSGYLGFAGGIATWVFTLPGGALADRVPRRTIIIVTQTAMMILAFILSALTFTRTVTPVHILVLAFFLGVANAFDAPARQAFVLEMVDRKSLTNAIALNSTLFNMGTAIGPAVGGLTYAFFGPGWCFFLNGASFLAVIGALLAMKLSPMGPSVQRGHLWRDIKEGLLVVRENRLIMALVIMIGMMSLFGMSFVNLFPAWAVNVLGGDATTNGYLQSARGVGALIAALGIATLVARGGRGKMITAGMFLFPAALIAFSFTRSLPFALGVLLFVGAGAITMMNVANSLVQTLSPDSMRGRVMGIYTLSFMGFLPIGSLIVGAFAQRFGEPLTVMLSALVMLACALGITLAVPALRKQE